MRPVLSDDLFAGIAGHLDGDVSGWSTGRHCSASRLVAADNISRISTRCSGWSPTTRSARPDVGCGNNPLNGRLLTGYGPDLTIEPVNLGGIGSVRSAMLKA